MNRFRRTLLAFGILALILGIVGWGFYKKNYPYGSTHRCSKVLAMELRSFAEENGGKFPASENRDALGLSALLEKSPHFLDLVVGKAGDLDKARQFYEKNGYLLPAHSSWNYVEGLTSNDYGALAWEKIPLGHYGQKQSSNSREVIMTDGMVRYIPEKDWNEFLAHSTKAARE